MNDVTAEIVDMLLSRMVTPKYPDLIRRCNSVVRNNLIQIIIFVNVERYEKMMTFDGVSLKGLDDKIRNEVKSALKYLGMHELTIFII